ncbi:MAG: hypothetical protein AVDCRST_MAG57-348, partial [uncultured Blastococcus sp.]
DPDLLPDRLRAGHAGPPRSGPLLPTAAGLAAGHRRPGVGDAAPRGRRHRTVLPAGDRPRAAGVATGTGHPADAAAPRHRRRRPGRGRGGRGGGGRRAHRRARGRRRDRAGVPRPGRAPVLPVRPPL